MQSLNNVRPKSDTAIGLALFLLAFIGAAINIPCFLSLQTESYFHRIIWRYLILGLLITPRFLYDLSANITSMWNILACNLLPIFFLSLLNTCYIYLICIAVNHTFVVHTLFLSSLGSTYIVVWKIIKGDSYTSIEYVGVGLNVLGVYLCCCEETSIESTFDV